MLRAPFDRNSLVHWTSGVRSTVGDHKFSRMLRASLTHPDLTGSLTVGFPGTSFSRIPEGSFAEFIPYPCTPSKSDSQVPSRDQRTSVMQEFLLCERGCNATIVSS